MLGATGLARVGLVLLVVRVGARSDIIVQPVEVSSAPILDNSIAVVKTTIITSGTPSKAEKIRRNGASGDDINVKDGESAILTRIDAILGSEQLPIGTVPPFLIPFITSYISSSVFKGSANSMMGSCVSAFLQRSLPLPGFFGYRTNTNGWMSPCMTAWMIGNQPQPTPPSYPGTQSWEYAPWLPIPTPPSPQPTVQQSKSPRPTVQSPAPPTFSPTVPVVPVVPITPEVSPGMGNTIHVQTIPRPVVCRQYPDPVTNDWSKAKNLTANTALRISCWAISTVNGVLGMVENDNIWMYERDRECWVSERHIDTATDTIKALPYCLPTPQHMFAGLQSQYSRQDCYRGPSLNAPSINLGSGSFVDVKCTIWGETVRGNYTWVKHDDQNCYFPGAVFDPMRWNGDRLPECP